MMEIKVIMYVTLPILVIAIWIGYNLFENYSLKKKNDNQSKIKVEARRPHLEEDHNRRLTKSEDSEFLWENSLDDGIQKKLKKQAEAKR